MFLLEAIHITAKSKSIVLGLPHLHQRSMTEIKERLSITYKTTLDFNLYYLCMNLHIRKARPIENTHEDVTLHDIIAVV